MRSTETPNMMATTLNTTKTIRILIVDDHPITRTGLRLAFKAAEDMEIVGEAANGQEAIDAVAELAPDLVLMDICMPVLDGIEATKRIKEQYPNIRVLMLTSYTDDVDLFAAFAGGADGYCLKDASRATLEIAIRSAYGGAVWLDPAVAGRIISASTNQRTVASMQKAKNVGGGIAPLTDREYEVLTLIVEGLSNQQIAQKLYVSAETIKTHVRHIMEKLRVSDRTQAAVVALRQGLI